MKRNPFEFEAAIRFTPDEMVDYFIDDHNFARFIDSQRNVFLLGDRGTGKTMMLRYYSLPIQACKHRRDTPNKDMSEMLKTIGIYVPCRNTALGKPEPEMLEPLLGQLMSEHIMVVAVVHALADALASCPELVTDEEAVQVKEQVRGLLQWSLPEGVSVFVALRLAALRESVEAQRTMNQRIPDSYYDNAVTFASAVLPLVDVVTTCVKKLSESHFSIMFDDADALSDMQNATLNTWIASRDNSKISFKVATSLVDQKSLRTAHGGELLERHDFIRVDMEQDFQNSDAAYYELAKDIVEKRLSKCGIKRTAEEFFPISTRMAADLEKAEAEARRDAEARYPNGTAKQIGDFVYKFGRAYYFRNRSSKANRPPYSGFNLIVHVSTGVIRYLLEPCYAMYDVALSKLDGKVVEVQGIEPSIQAERLEELSKRRWGWVKQGFNNSIRGCTRDDAKSLSQLLENLAVFFTHRLHHHRSEPRAIAFSISGSALFDRMTDLERLLEIARRAQILFRRMSSGKDGGNREYYYTFDRLLWIVRGLDPVGQNACISIEARYLWEAAFKNSPLPKTPKEKSERGQLSSGQRDMFDGELV